MTESQRRCLLAIQRLTARRGYGPSLSEIAREMGRASKGSLVLLINSLSDQGFIRKLPNRQRSIEVIRPVEEKVAWFAFDDERKELVPYSEIQSRREA